MDSLCLLSDFVHYKSERQNGINIVYTEYEIQQSIYMLYLMIFHISSISVILPRLPLD